MTLWSFFSCSRKNMRPCISNIKIAIAFSQTIFLFKLGILFLFLDFEYFNSYYVNVLSLMIFYKYKKLLKILKQQYLTFCFYLLRFDIYFCTSGFISSEQHNKATIVLSILSTIDFSISIESITFYPNLCVVLDCWCM